MESKIADSGYRSFNNFPSVGLCFSGFFFFSITIWPAGGVPTRSRAISLTAVTARNDFFFFLRPGMLF